jgi:hypothetical protein
MHAQQRQKKKVSNQGCRQLGTLLAGSSTTCRLKHHLQASTQAVKPKTTLLKWLHRHSMAHRDAALHLPTQTTQATHHILQNAIALGQQLSLLGFLLLVVGPQPLNLSLAAKQGAA